MSNHIFVYGTLKRGEHNNSLLQGCDFVSTAVVPGAALLNLGGCPGLVICRTESRDCAKGEIYLAHDLDYILKRLDRLENEGSFYKRVILTAYETDWNNDVVRMAHPINCYTYLYMPAFAGSSFVEGGDWRLRSHAWGP